MNVNIQTNIEVTTDDLKRACTPEELGMLISDLANALEEAPDRRSDHRRKLCSQIRDGLSENAKRLLAEVMAYEYASSHAAS